MKANTLHTLTLASALAVLGACNDSGSSFSTVASTVDASEFTHKPEAERLRYFKEIGMEGVRQQGLTGAGVRVTIMGEAIDVDHPDLKQRVNKQYNTFASKGKVLSGEQNQPYGFDKMGYGDGHGTHIAGTVAAECDGKGVQGVACGTILDAYDLGAYDSASRFNLTGWGNTHEFARLMSAFATAMDDVTAKSVSKITTGSFNMEAPMIRLSPDSMLARLSLTEIINRSENINSLDELFDGNQVKLVNPDDLNYLKTAVSHNDDDTTIALGAILPLSQEWQTLAAAIHRYQQGGGVYLITESNYPLGRTSVLNAMPSLSDQVDRDLWLSVVLVQPEGIDEATTIADVDAAIAAGKYKTPLNHCGKVAAEYCILTPSYSVLSTMTEKVREAELDLLRFDERLHQVYTGHSMGAPMVAAALALMQEKNRDHDLGYSMKDLVRILKQSSNRTFNGYDPHKHGQGILDVGTALKQMEKKT